MSKHKHERERQRAHERTLPKYTAANPPSHEAKQAENKSNTLQATQDDGKDATNNPMGFRKLLQMPSVTDYVVALFTVVLAVVAGYQGFITNRQLDVMRNDERAWIKVNVVKVHDSTGDHSPIIANTGTPAIVPLTIENTGKTVAKNIDLYTYVEVLDYFQEPSLGWVDNNPKHASAHSFTGLFFPSDTQTFQVTRVGNDHRNQIVTQEESDGLDRAHKYIAVFGVAYYDDVFKVRHWTKFCVPFSYGGSYDFGNCVAFNSEGEVNGDGKNL